MYNLPYYKAKDKQQVMEFLYDHPFAVITGCGKDNRPVATQVPLLIKERNGKHFLQGHLMRNTDHHLAFETNPGVLVVFTGPHAYVSASWYSDQRQAGTWNYLTVHVKGTLAFKDHDFLLNILKETIAHFENDDASPSLFKHLPTEYVEKLSKAIVGFEIEVEAIDHVFKLSQNRDDESYQNIIEQLSLGDFDAQHIAALMKKNKQS